MAPSLRWRRLTRRAASLTAVAAALVVAACGSGGGAPSPSPGPVALVGAEEISHTLYDMRLQSALTAIQQGGGPAQGTSAYSAMLRQLRADVVKSLIFDAVIAQEADFRHIAASDADVQKELQSDADAAGGWTKLQQQAAEAGGSLDQLRDAIRSRINEQRLEDVFAQQRAQAVVQQLAAGQPFTTLATQLSDDDTSRPKGGDMGVLTLDQLRQGDAALMAAVMALSPGQTTTTAVRDNAGYEILRLDAATATSRSVHRILVAAPRPYTVKERPAWFAQSVLDAIAADCAAGRLTVYLDAGVQPCSGGAATSPAPAPASPGPTSTATAATPAPSATAGGNGFTPYPAGSPSPGG